MIAYVIRRFLQMIPILIIVTAITFVIVNASGSPLSAAEFNPRLKPEDIEHMRQNLGLDKPVSQRYFIWLSHVARGDLGNSMINYRPVSDRILEVLPNTLLLASLSLLLSWIIAIPLGVLAALRRNSMLDRALNIGAVAGFAVPTVWLGMILILIFSVQFKEWGLHTLPVGGVRNLRGGGGTADRIEHMIMPVLALAIPQIAFWLLYVRSQMVEVINQDYMRTAIAKGLTRQQVIFRHGFRNAVLPLVTLVGLSLPGLFAGTFVVENIFAYPGMGRLTITAIGDKDYTVVMGTTLFFAVLVILGNLLADILYAVVDPRIRLE